MMETPDRLLDMDATPLELALLREGRAYTAPKDARANTLKALGVAGAGGVVGGLLAWFASKSWAGKILVSLSSLAVVSAGPVAYLLYGRTEPVPALAAHKAPSAPAPQEAFAPPSASTDEPALAVAEEAPRKGAASKGPSGGTSALRREVSALDTIRSRLARGDAQGALRAVNAYFQSFPGGRLRLEAEVLRIDALAKSGNAAAAKRHARDFIQHHPNSVLTERVRPYTVR